MKSISVSFRNSSVQSTDKIVKQDDGIKNKQGNPSLQSRDSS